MHICFFPDKSASNFKPLTLTRPFDDLRVGIFTIREKWIKTLRPQHWSRKIETYLGSCFKSDDLQISKNILWINSRVLPENSLLKAIAGLKQDYKLVWNNEVIAASTSSSVDDIFNAQLEAIELRDEPKLLTHFWDLLSLNPTEIKSDCRLLLASFGNKNQFHPSVIIDNPENVFIHETAKIEPGSILITENGPIYIGPGAIIEAGAIIRGPVAVCENAQVKMGARISNGTTIGPVCKVGGEVNNSIFHSYSNKAHEGFTGNSIIGQWCNFGADTNTSNLKNNYSRVTLPHWDSGEVTKEGVQFFGTVFGDFSKTAINTSLNTGTICGVSSNIFCSGFPQKVIPSFSWVGDGIPEIYEFDKAINAMQAMMKRRGIEISPEFIEMMAYLFSSEYSSSS